MNKGPLTDLNEKWKIIVELHNESKALFLLCEETEPHEFKSFLQPFNELRHAYEHAVRAKANELNLDGDAFSQDYQNDSLDKAIGHEFRGFFDCADWLAVILREQVEQTLRCFETRCIQAVLPDYYSQYRSRIIEISESIALVRGDKDVAKDNPNDVPQSMDEGQSILNEVRRYKSLLSELQGIHKTIMSTEGSLQEYSDKLASEERGKSKAENRRRWLIVIAGAALGVLGKSLLDAIGRSRDSAPSDQKK